MLRTLFLTLSLLSLGVWAPAYAESTICSDPSRAKVLDRGTISLPQDDVKALERAMFAAAPRINMTTWAVVGSQGDGEISSHNIGLQSPEVSVAIDAIWEPGWKHAKITIERTCYDDALEPWEGLWSSFLREMKEAGYEVKRTV